MNSVQTQERYSVAGDAWILDNGKELIEFYPRETLASIAELVRRANAYDALVEFVAKTADRLTGAVEMAQTKQDARALLDSLNSKP